MDRKTSGADRLRPVGIAKDRSALHDRGDLHSPAKELHSISGKEIRLRLFNQVPADESRGWLPSLEYGIYMPGIVQPVGGCSLRIGYTPQIEQYRGNIGYRIREQWRGRYFAGKACLLLREAARAHGMPVLWITCNPENIASRKTCEWIGAEYLETVELPPEESKLMNATHKRRYRWQL